MYGLCFRCRWRNHAAKDCHFVDMECHYYKRTYCVCIPTIEINQERTTQTKADSPMNRVAEHQLGGGN